MNSINNTDTDSIERLAGRASFVLTDAMDLLTQIPQGGIGDAGATLAEIEAAEADGRCVEDDATYHVVQKAWLKLRLLMPLLRERYQSIGCRD